MKTAIYHKSAAEPYVLPYTSEHPHHIRRNIPYASLLRAARICSHVNHFNSERIRIDVSPLLNGYPPNFISKHFHQFFYLNSATSVLNQLDEHTYPRLHQKLLYQKTRREKELTKMMEDPVVPPTVLQPKIWNHKILHPHYIFDHGQSVDFPKQFSKWWQTYYTSPVLPAHNIQIRLVADINPSLETLLIKKKPSRDLLTKMELA
jgi:hypothetical protein